MKGEAQMTVPELARVLGTRLALGVGLGFLLGNRFTEQERRAIGWTLLLGGAFLGTTIGFDIFGRPRAFHLAFGTAEPESQERVPRQRTDQAGVTADFSRA
jgi:hypothetical protein